MRVVLVIVALLLGVESKSGQYITVMLERGNIRVKSVVKALEGGCYGQTIRVKNEATKDVFDVAITGPQTATLNATGEIPLPPKMATVDKD